MTLIFKYRVKDRMAARCLREHANAVNQVWNWCVAQQRDVMERYRSGARPRRWSTHYDLARECRGVGAMLGIHQHTVQVACHQFTAARDRIKRAPRFRSSFGAKRALGWVPFQKQSRKIEGNSIIYLGQRFRWFGDRRRPLPETAKGGFFVEDAQGRWWVCFHVEAEPRSAVIGGEIGIDLGLRTLATLSDGNKIEAPKHYRALEHKLVIAQRARNERRVRAIHARIANARKDFLHKITTDLARSNALIAVGNVNAKKLVRTSMAKSVLDAGWSTFRTMLRYKSPGFIEVDEAFTTQACSSCGSLPPERPRGIAGLGIRVWDCSDCGASHDRDVNAARNILALARSVAGPVEGSREVRHGH